MPKFSNLSNNDNRHSRSKSINNNTATATATATARVTKHSTAQHSKKNTKNTVEIKIKDFPNSKLQGETTLCLLTNLSNSFEYLVHIKYILCRRYPSQTFR